MAFRALGGAPAPTRGAIGAPAPSRAIVAPTPAAAKNRANVEANRPDSGVDLNDPAKKQELDAENEAAAGRSSTENQALLTGKNDRTPEQNEASARDGDGNIDKQDKSTETQENRNNTDTDQEKSIKDKLKTPAGIALIAALGLTIALVTTLLVMSGEDLKACKEAKITVTKIEPSPVGTGIGRYIPFLSRIVKPKTIDVTYTCTTDYQPIAGKESLTFHDTGFPEFDEIAIAVKKVVSKNKIQLECGTNDCSDFNGTKGSADPNCGDFSDYFNQQVQDAAKGTGDFFGNIASGFADNWSSWLFIIMLCVGLYILATKVFKS